MTKHTFSGQPNCIDCNKHYVDCECVKGTDVSNSMGMSGWEKVIENGTPCDHPGCKNHFTHPCEKCGRKAAFGRAIISRKQEGEK